MTTIRVEDDLPRVAVDFLKHCYRFVAEEWQHADRDGIGDQGFERGFRSSCITRLSGWQIAQEREMRFGSDLSTASGVLHEIDIVAQHFDATVMMELKNWQGPPDKNDVIVFFAKILDYLSSNPDLLLKDLCPIFMTTSAFDQHGLAACVGLGIHPVGPGLRPIPVLIDNARRIEFEFGRGLRVPDETRARFEDFCAELNGACLALADNWLSSRFGRSSETTIVMKAANGSDSVPTSHLLRQLNSECNWLLSSVREAMQ